MNVKKICAIHGELSDDQIAFYKKPNRGDKLFTRCRLCRRLSSRNYEKKHWPIKKAARRKERMESLPKIFAVIDEKELKKQTELKKIAVTFTELLIRHRRLTNE